MSLTFQSGGDVCFAHMMVADLRADTAFQRKGANLFNMIPLERWNVERSVSSCGKREVLDVSSTSSRTPNSLLERV